jgi:hypothetical protein
VIDALLALLWIYVVFHLTPIIAFLDHILAMRP